MDLLKTLSEWETNFELCYHSMHFPNDSAGKESACSAGDTGDLGSIPGLGRCPGGGNGDPIQYSHLKNPMHRGAW